MVTNYDVTLYRVKVSRLLASLRNALYLQSGKTSFPTDASISALLGLSTTAFSAINRQCASMSGPSLLKLMQELSKLSNDFDFIVLFRDFANC